MEAKFISEVWEAMSVLSDAQESLVGVANLTPLQYEGFMAADDLINHAKKHLAQFLKWSSSEHHHEFVRGTLVMECTLQEEGGEPDAEPV